ncbi:MAG TPA: hypothetical protein VF178_08785 [Gemmatimonadaceae bacterium]
MADPSKPPDPLVWVSEPANDPPAPAVVRLPVKRPEPADDAGEEREHD